MYEHDAQGRLSSSTTTLEPEWSPADTEWLEALHIVEHQQGPHGFLMVDATSEDADPNNPDATHRFVAGTPVRDPETGALEWAVTFDWAEKSKLDLVDKIRGNDPDPLNGAIIPVHRIARQSSSARARRSPLARHQAAQRALPPPPTT